MTHFVHDTKRKYSPPMLMIERFNRTYREEVLNYYVFHRLSEVRAITQNWITTYNEERPHDALGGLTPVAFAKAKQL
jgi:putative transposase